MSTDQECPKILESIGIRHTKEHQSIVFIHLKECFLVSCSVIFCVFELRSVGLFVWFWVLVFLCLCGSFFFPALIIRKYFVFSSSFL